MTFNLPNVKGRYKKDYSLAKISWFGVGGSAELLFIPDDLEDLQFFLQNKPSNISVTVLGVGSNVLVRDGGISGVVIRLGKGFNYIHHDDQFIYAGAAVLDLNLALYCRDYALQGLEFFSGIPGTVGGALAMNAGAYGEETSKILNHVRAININNGKIQSFKIAEIGYKYRGKQLSEDWIFVEGIFNYSYGNKELISEKIKDIQEQRVATQPIKTRTAGSTFKNPGILKAWELIDNAGCRGLKIGGAQISEQHCNFIINTGNASATDIENLVIEVQDRVLKASGVKLETEIKIIGNHGR